MFDLGISVASNFYRFFFGSKDHKNLLSEGGWVRGSRINLQL